MNVFKVVKYFFVFFLLNGCIFQKNNQPQANRWLKIALSDKIAPANWNQCSDKACLQYATLVMEGLLKWKQGENSVEVEPSLCESWNLESPDTLSLKLRENVKWTNGNILSSIDFLETWKRILSSPNLEPSSSLFHIQNAKAFRQSQLSFDKVGLSAPSPNSLIIKFEKSDNFSPTDFLNYLASPLLYPTFNGKTDFTITIGKFKLLANSKNDTSIFVKNIKYYGTASQIDGIEVRVVKNPQIRTQLFLDKEVDFIEDLPNEIWSHLSLTPQLSLSPRSLSFVLFFNSHHRPFDLPKVRESFVRSIDRSEFKDLLRLPILINFYLNPAIQSPNAPSWFPKYNPISANETLRNEKMAHSIPCLLGYPKDSVAEKVALNLQAQWAKNLDYKIEVEPISLNRFSKLGTDTHAMFILPVQTDYLLRTEFPFQIPSIHPSNLAKTQESLISKDYLVYPLYQATRLDFRSNNFLTWKQPSSGFWDLGLTESRI